MNYIAIKDSYGFRGRYWKTGTVAENVTPEEEQMPEIKLFKPVDKNYKKPVEEPAQPMTLQEYGLGEKTNKELKALLDGKGIQYPPTANKAMLIELLTGGGV
jgi:hypothetical protein